jgi:WD40 repeat protein
MPDLTGPGVRVLLIATRSPGAGQAIRAALLERCGVPPGQLVALFDPADVGPVRAELDRCAGAAETLLVYCLGPGLIGPDGEPYLAVGSTGELRPGRAGFQALSVSALAGTVRNRAERTLVIVDAVAEAGFAGPVAERLAGTGFVLVSAVPEAGRAELTTALADLLEHGDPRGPTWITAADSHLYLRRRLGRAGVMVHRRGHDDSDAVVLTVNRAQPDRAGQPPLLGHSPWPGLDAFDPDDADRFFGRDEVSDELVRRTLAAVEAAVPLIVIGPSGIGKTSLLRAGLLAKLQAGVGTARWRPVFITLGSGQERLDGLGPGVLLVVDQLEQLFTPDRSRDDVSAFLTALTAQASAGVAVVLGLRADHYARAVEYPQLERAEQMLIGPIDRAGLRQVIERPAADAGLELEPGLTDFVLDELVSSDSRATGHGVLPMLSHTLWRLWQQQRDDELTLAGYRSTGGITEAIRTSAEEIFTGLSPGEQDSARRILPRLVRIDDELPFTARTVALDDLVRGEPEPAARRVLDRFAHGRLITLDERAARFSHEVLIGTWTRLADWLHADQDWLRVRQRLDRDARIWERAGRDRSLLYRGDRLDRVNRPGARPEELDPVARQFVRASARSERRGDLARPVLIGALVVLLVTTLITAGAIVVLGRRTVTQRDAVAVRALIDEADRIRPVDPGLAKQLELAAYRIDPEKSQQSLISTLGQPGMFDSDQSIADLARSRDGRLLVFSAVDRLLLEDGDGIRLSTITGLATGSIALGSDRKFLAAGTGPAGSTDRRTQLRLWDVADPAHPKSLADVPAGPGDLLSVTLSPDQRQLATAAADGTLTLWDLTDLRAPRRLHSWSAGRAAVVTVIFAAHGSILVSTGQDARTRLWQLTDPGRPRLLSSVRSSAKIPDQTAIQRRLDLDPTGRYLLGVISDQTTTRSESPQVWDLNRPDHPRAIGAEADALGCYSPIRGAVWIKSMIMVSCQTNPTVFSFDPERKRAKRIDWLGSYSSDMGTELSTGDGGPLLAADPGLYGAGGRGVLVWPVTTPLQAGARAGVTSVVSFLPVNILIDRLPDGRQQMVENTSLGQTRVWDLASRRLSAMHTVFHSDGVGLEEIAGGGGLAISPDRHLFAAAELDHHRAMVSLYSQTAPAAPALGTITDLHNGALELAFNRDGTLLAVVDNTADTRLQPHQPGITLYDVRDPHRPVVVGHLPADVTDLAYSPDGLLVGFGQGPVQVWDISDPRHPVNLPGLHGVPGTATSGSFSPDGTRFMLNDGRRIRIWTVHDRRLAGSAVTLGQSYGILGSASFSADSRTLVVSGQEQGQLSKTTIDFWDLHDRAVPEHRAGWSFQDTLAPGQPLALDLTGRTLAVMGSSALLLWDLDPAAALTAACRSSGHVITRAEWEHYIPVRRYDPPCGQEHG